MATEPEDALTGGDELEQLRASLLRLQGENTALIVQRDERWDRWMTEGEEFQEALLGAEAEVARLKAERDTLAAQLQQAHNDIMTIALHLSAVEVERDEARAALASVTLNSLTD